MKKRTRRLWITGLIFLVPLIVYTIIDPSVLPFDVYRPKQADLAVYENYAYYQSLPENQQLNYSRVYEKIAASIDKADCLVRVQGDYLRGISVKLPCALHSVKEVSALYTAVQRDFPEFLFLEPRYYYSTFKLGDHQLIYSLKVTYNRERSARARNVRELNEAADDLMAQMPEGLDEYGKELFLHDELLKRCTYDTAVPITEEGGKESPDSFTAYGALVKGKAVCDGYARAMLFLLRRAGLDARVVSGQSARQDGDHLWNLVTVDGKPYYLDPTWNDGEVIMHTYFNMDDATLKQRYVPDENNCPLPACDSDAANFFVRNRCLLSGYRQSEIASRTADAIKQGRPAELCFTTDDSYQNACQFMDNSSWFIATVNARLSGTEQMLKDYVYYRNDSCRVITVCKKTA